MVFIKGASVFFSLLSIVAGKYTCPSGYAGQTGTPLCAGVTGDTCSAGKCCKLTGKLCSSENAIGGNAKCKTGSDKHYFFDLKKNAGVAASSSDDNFRATCCTTCSQATCADWKTVKGLVGCGTGKSILGTKNLPSSDCSYPDDAKYKDTCCVTTPTTCSATGVLTGNKQCKAAEPKNFFFDLKKGAVKVASGDFKSSCCTDCAAATCADWATAKFLVPCSSGKTKVGTNKLASSDCSIPADDKYKDACCVTTPTTCSATGVSKGNTQCKAADPKNVFFDLKKGAVKYASGDFKSSCCTDCAAATCADWATVKLLVGCPNGKVKSSKTVLPSSDCSIPSDAKYKETCCQTPMKCADYAAEASAALPKAVASAMVLVGLHSLFI